MKLKLTQTCKELYSADFVIRRGKNEIGSVYLKGRLGSAEAKIQGMLYNFPFEMHYGKSKAIRSKAFRPYVLLRNGQEIGAVYQAEFKEGLFRYYSLHQLVIDNTVINLYPLSFKDGAKCPVYLGEEQISQIEKDCVVYNDLHEYVIYARDENAAMASVILSMYMYMHGAYKPGVKTTKSVERYFGEEKNQRFLDKYNPLFKESISE